METTLLWQRLTQSNIIEQWIETCTGSAGKKQAPTSFPTPCQGRRKLVQLDAGTRVVVSPKPVRERNKAG